MKMPKLSPISIKTKNRNIFMRIWVWITTVREWKTLEDWYYDLADGTRIVIPKDFVFDGASVPKPLWILLSPTGLLLIPGLIHDFAYRYDYLWEVKQLGEKTEYIKYKHKAGQHYWDALFRKVGKEVNGMAIIDTLAWAALFLGGWLAWRSNRKRKDAELFPKEYKQSR